MSLPLSQRGLPWAVPDTAARAGDSARLPGGLCEDMEALSITDSHGPDPACSISEGLRDLFPAVMPLDMGRDHSARPSTGLGTIRERKHRWMPRREEHLFECTSVKEEISDTEGCSVAPPTRLTTSPGSHLSRAAPSTTVATAAGHPSNFNGQERNDFK